MVNKLLVLFIAAFAIFSCATSDSETEAIPNDNFDRGAMLTNIANNIIEPAYQDFDEKMAGLTAAGTTFTNNPNQENLDVLRTSWLVAYKTWQHVEMFNIGKAEELQYSFFMNIYPLTVADVESNIAKGSYNLNSPNNHDAQGFPALDYLLYGVAANDAAIIAKYTTATNNDNYKKYLTDVLNQMSTLTNTVFTDFKANKSTFVTGTANTATSTVNKFINDYIFYYEKGLRANKFGIPAGVFSDSELPEKVEAFYKQDVSKELALEALTAVKNVFEGRHYKSTVTGESFQTYLIELKKQDLATSIVNQFNDAEIEINKINASFTVELNSDSDLMTRAYDKLQRAVVFLKLDMLQVFNVSVDFVDADGD